MDIQYKHKRNDLNSDYDRKDLKWYFKGVPRGITYAVNVPSKLEVVEQIDNEQRKATIEVGFSTCSRVDHYNKKIGRELATSRMQKMEFEVSSISFRDNESYFTLDNLDKNNYDIRQINFKLNKNSNRIHLLSVQ